MQVDKNIYTEMSFYIIVVFIQHWSQLNVYQYEINKMQRGSERLICLEEVIKINASGKTGKGEKNICNKAEKENQCPVRKRLKSINKLQKK